MIPEIRNHSNKQRLKDLELISLIQGRIRGQLLKVFKYLNSSIILVQEVSLTATSIIGLKIMAIN